MIKLRERGRQAIVEVVGFKFIHTVFDLSRDKTGCVSTKIRLTAWWIVVHFAGGGRHSENNVGRKGIGKWGRGKGGMRCAEHTRIRFILSSWSCKESQREDAFSGKWSICGILGLGRKIIDTGGDYRGSCWVQKAIESIGLRERSCLYVQYSQGWGRC